MKDFDWTRFTVKIAVKADQRTVYDAWTSSAAIERWFLSKAVFRNDAGADLAPTEGVGPGCTYAWNWYGFDVTEQGRILGASDWLDGLAFDWLDALICRCFPD